MQNVQLALTLNRMIKAPQVAPGVEGYHGFVYLYDDVRLWTFIFQVSVSVSELLHPFKQTLYSN